MLTDVVQFRSCPLAHPGRDTRFGRFPLSGTPAKPQKERSDGTKQTVGQMTGNTSRSLPSEIPGACSKKRHIGPAHRLPDGLKLAEIGQKVKFSQ